MDASESGESLLTVDEVAEILKLNPQTIRNRIDAGEISAVRIGRSVRIQRSVLEKSIGLRAEQSPDSRHEGAPFGVDHELVAAALDDISAAVAKLAQAIRGR